MAIEVGAKVKGKVSGITKFGAFVDLGEGKNGLVHISEVSNHFIQDIHEVLKLGDEVQVKVLAISEDGKINLSMRRCEEKENKKQNPRDDYKKKAPMNKGNKKKKQQDFESLMNDFLKTSEENLLSLRRNTEGKRGGRGGRRS